MTSHVADPGSGDEPLRVLLCEGVHAEAAAVLRSAGFEVAEHAGALGVDELVPALEGVGLLGIRSGTHVPSEVLAAAPSLRAIGAFCVGTNQVDLAAAAAAGVPVFNAPFSNTRSVVELALAGMLACTRRLTVKDAALHAGVWDKSAAGAHEMRGRRLGIVGYGNIGSQLGALAEALGMSVVFYDTADKLARGNAVRAGSLDELLAAVDVVSLHVDGRAGNAGLFGEQQFAAMRKGALFLNLSRGFVVDYGALAEHVRSGHLAGAAVDVFPKEPRRTGDAFTSELQGLPNVVLTPHVGGSTVEAQREIGVFVAGKLRDYATAGSTAMAVNVPEVSLERRPGSSRLAHLHANTPGVLAKITGVLGNDGINIEGQMLATAGTLGYLLVDTSVPLSRDDVDALAGLPETVRLTVLP
jgi:D-3-phosphoglycerate dehydrogenase